MDIIDMGAFDQKEYTTKPVKRQPVKEIFSRNILKSRLIPQKLC